jgi:hypothetical protein
LRREFVDLSFKPEESVEDFSLDLNTVASQLQVLGDEMADKEVIKKMLHAIPDKLEQVAISMETLLNLDTLSIKEVIGHRRVVEQRKKPTPTKDNDGRLLLTEEEWTARMKSHEGSAPAVAPMTVEATATVEKMVANQKKTRPAQEKRRNPRRAATMFAPIAAKGVTRPMNVARR